MSSDFEKSLRERSAADYADFLVPHLHDGSLVLDVGCGQGTITIGLAGTAGHVVGVDLSEEKFGDARNYAADHGIGNAGFRVGSVDALDFPADHFDACLCHSMLETLDHPLDALVEIKRTLKPDGVIGVACVEYGGLVPFSYGTPDAVERFGEARAEDCGGGYASSAQKHGLATAADLEAMRRAWLAWSRSPEAYLAFAWCRAVGWKPSEKCEPGNRLP